MECPNCGKYETFEVKIDNSRMLLSNITNLRYKKFKGEKLTIRQCNICQELFCTHFVFHELVRENVEFKENACRVYKTMNIEGTKYRYVNDFSNNRKIIVRESFFSKIKSYPVYSKTNKIKHSEYEKRKKLSKEEINKLSQAQINLFTLGASL
jgi:hypothetical protein